MEVLIEQDVIAPVGIGLELLRPAENRPSIVFISLENPDQPPGDLLAHLIQVHHISRTGRTLHFKVIAVVEIVLQQGAVDQRIDWEPDRTSPVGVASEHAGVRLSWKVIHTVLLAFDVEDVRMLLVNFGERADAIGA